MSEHVVSERPSSERGTDLRLARLHLRSGTHALARAELETLAGTDGLDRDGVLDLAEVRWRTGDLAGASVAASAWLEDGDDAGPRGALAHVICAEAAAARGALDAAGAHVDAAARGLGERAALDAILAGIASRAPWPWAEEAPPASPATGPDPASAPLALAGAAGAAGGVPPSAARPAGAPVTPAAAHLTRVGGGLVAEAPERAVVLLVLALRADRAAAEGVLAVLDAANPGPVHAAAFSFVRGEALRAAGRHDESRIAYASAESLALAPVETDAPRSPQ